MLRRGAAPRPTNVLSVKPAKLGGSRGGGNEGGATPAAQTRLPFARVIDDNYFRVGDNDAEPARRLRKRLIEAHRSPGPDGLVVLAPGKALQRPPQ